MNSILRGFLCLTLILTPLTAMALFDKKSADEEREELQEARTEAIKKLYREKPSAKSEIQNARGYAVFSNFGLNIGFISSQRGGGILRDNRSGKDVYMKMFSAGGGWGLGVKNFAAILIFENDEALNQFETSGWDFSAQADANAESGSEGDGAETAVTAMPGTTIYQLTESGVALQATVQGTKFWVDEDLN